MTIETVTEDRILDQWQPMPYIVGQRISLAGWRAYRDYLTEHPWSDSVRHRPNPATAAVLWDLVAADWGPLDHLLPAYDWLPADERLALAPVAKEAAAVALEAIMSSETLTANALFDALALRWSHHYRRALQTTPARSSWEMRAETIKASRLDLALNGINFEALVLASRKGASGLYETKRRWIAAEHRYGGHTVVLKPGMTAEWTRYGAALVADSSWRAERPDRILPVGGALPKMHIDSAVAGEWAYNRAVIGERTKELQRRLANAAMDLNATAMEHELVGLEAAGEDRAAIALRLELQHLRWDGLVDDDGFVRIKSAFYKTMNRRYQPTNFWLSEIKAHDTDDQGDWENGLQVETFRRARWFKAPAIASGARQDLVGVDVSGSQVQILAVLLGLEDLEQALLTASFKKTAADRAWAKHVASAEEDPFELPAGFTGPDDPKLQNACKKAVMTVLYGSDPKEVAYKLAGSATGSERQRKIFEDFGPGLGGGDNVMRLLHDPELRLGPIFTKFLPACQRIAAVAMEASKYAGVEFVDPFDNARFRWNPIRTTRPAKKPKGNLRPKRRAPVSSSNGVDLYANLPRGARDQNGDYPVDAGKLKRDVAPCLTHMLDALYAGLVVERLNGLGVMNVASVHDCWIVGQDAGLALSQAIVDVGEPWLRMLGPVYDELAAYLGEDVDYKDWVAEIRQKWQQRVEAGRWPEFRVSATDLSVTRIWSANAGIVELHGWSPGAFRFRPLA